MQCTSPIRRYHDLHNHYVLKNVMRTESTSTEPTETEGDSGVLATAAALAGEEEGIERGEIGGGAAVAAVKEGTTLEAKQQTLNSAKLVRGISFHPVLTLPHCLLLRIAHYRAALMPMTRIAFLHIALHCTDKSHAPSSSSILLALPISTIHINFTSTSRCPAAEANTGCCSSSKRYPPPNREECSCAQL
jgi:hypothetical protein